MSKISLSALYIKNAKSVLSNVREICTLEHKIEDDMGNVQITPNYGTVIGFIAWLITLPITTTVGAGIKALIDFFSRKEIPDELIGETEENLKNAPAEKITELVKQITDYSTQSKSSDCLRKKLNKSSYDSKKAVHEEKMLLKKEQLGLDCTSKYKEQYILNLELDDGRATRLNQYDLEATTKLSTQQKTTITEYLQAAHNQGKKTQHIICNFFNPIISSFRIFICF